MLHVAHIRDGVLLTDAATYHEQESVSGILPCWNLSANCTLRAASGVWAGHGTVRISARRLRAHFCTLHAYFNPLCQPVAQEAVSVLSPFCEILS